MRDSPAPSMEILISLSLIRRRWPSWVLTGSPSTATSSSSSSKAEPEKVVASPAAAPQEESGSRAEDLEVQKKKEASKPTEEHASEPPAKKNMDVMEVARTVDAAVKAKEKLAEASIAKAREDMEKRKKELEAQFAEEQRRLEEEEQRLAKLQDELKTGLTETDKAHVQKLRSSIEGVGREVVALEREVATRKLAMQRATDSYVEAEESLASKREARRRLEEEMLDLILSTGKAKDEKLNQVLQNVPEVGASASVKQSSPSGEVAEPAPAPAPKEEESEAPKGG
mmetsp:Transcript_48693/g.115718  ORF Transcript_48693/g.115718 Transcript_48693/m.115718 type:complete len:284 (+) Transcript_48693:1681-2532(+)